MKRLMTRAGIFDRYGPRLSMDQVAEVLGIAPASVYNLITTGQLAIPTYKEGARRFASYEAIADYLDNLADKAAEEYAKKKPGH